MKNRIPSLAVLVIATISFAVSSAVAQQDAFNEGVRLFKEEKYADALQMFNIVLKQKPGYVYARSYSNQCKAAIARGAGAKRDLRAELSKIILPKVSFEDAPIGDVMTYLAKRADELSGGKSVPNFIYKGSADQRTNTVLSLNLRNVPLTEAIRYIGQLSSSRIDYEEHAVVVDPRSNTPSVNASPAAQTPENKSGSIPFGSSPKSDPFGN